MLQKVSPKPLGQSSTEFTEFIFLQYIAEVVNNILFLRAVSERSAIANKNITPFQWCFFLYSYLKHQMSLDQ